MRVCCVRHDRSFNIYCMYYVHVRIRSRVFFHNNDLGGGSVHSIVGSRWGEGVITKYSRGQINTYVVS